MNTLDIMHNSIIPLLGGGSLCLLVGCVAGFRRRAVVAVTTCLLGFAAILTGMFFGAHVFRTPAPRAPCTNNLAQIGKCFKMYSMDHEERFPDSLGYLSPEYMDHAKLLYCPRSGTKEQRLPYILVPGLSETNADSSVHAHCPAGSHDGRGGNILFVDGSVDWFFSEYDSEFDRDRNGPSFEEVIRKGQYPQQEH